MGIIDRLAARLGYRKAAQPVQADWLRLTAESEGDNIPGITLPRGQSDIFTKLSWVQAAISAVSRAAATTGFGVMSLVGEKTESIENHEFEVLLRRPNPLQSRFELLEATFNYLAITGNAYWWLNRRSEKAPPVEIWVLPAYRVRPVPDGKLFIKGYLYETENGDELPLEQYEIVHFKRFHPTSPFVGLSPLEALAVTVTGDIAMQKWNTNYFDKDNAKVPGALAFADPVENDTWEKIKADVNAKHGGTKRQMMMLRNVGKGGVQWLPMSMSQRDMEFLAGRTFNKEEIFSIYAPGYASMLAVNATEANSKAGKATFMEMAVWPQLVAVAEKITNDLLPVYGDNLVGEFDDVRISDRDLRLREQAAAARVQKIDEIRATYYSLQPLEDGRGNRLLSEAPPPSATEIDGHTASQLAQVYSHPALLESGFITTTEARAGLRLGPLAVPPPAEFEAKFKAIAAGQQVGIPTEALLQLMGLSTDLLPSVDSVTVAQPKQLPPPQDAPQPEQSPQDVPQDAPAQNAAQAEAKALRKWLRNRPNADIANFKAAHLSPDEVQSIYAEVRQGVAPDADFFRKWQSYP